MSISYQKKKVIPPEGSNLEFTNNSNNDCESIDTIFIKILVEIPNDQITSGRIEYEISETSAAFYKFSGQDGEYKITRHFENMDKNFYRQFSKKIICTENTNYGLTIRVTVYDDNGNYYPIAPADSNYWDTTINCP